MNPNTVLLAVAIWPGRTAYQLAGQLGLRSTYGNRRQPNTYPVITCLTRLQAEGYVRHEDIPGGRGHQGWHRLWFVERKP